MATKNLKTDRAHVVYKNAAGKRVPGVTTITGVLAKPALIAWANRMGLEGIDTAKYVDTRAEMGTLAHNMVEAWLLGNVVDTTEYSPVVVLEAENSFLSFLAWIERHEYKVIDIEYQAVSESMQVGGTCDIYWILDGVHTLTDLKTGKGIYPEHKCQVVAYADILREHGRPVDRVSILNIPRGEDELFAYEEIVGEAVYRDVFLHCRDIYNLKKTVGWY